MLCLPMLACLHTPLSADANSTYPEDGWWWNPAEPGRGYFIEHQQQAMFIAAFTYTESGAPEWLVAVGEYSPAPAGGATIGQFYGRVFHNSGGQCVGCGYVAPMEAESVQSPLSISFADNQNGTLAWSGEAIPISRLLWAWVDALDQLSGTWLINRIEQGATHSEIVSITVTDDPAVAEVAGIEGDTLATIEKSGNGLVLILAGREDDPLPLTLPESKRFYAGYGDREAPQVVAQRLDDMPVAVAGDEPSAGLEYTLVDTGQVMCYDASGYAINCPGSGESLYGQDAQHSGNAADFVDNGNGTISDRVTGLTWQQSPDFDRDGDIDAADKLTLTEAQAYCDSLALAGYSDWRLPAIKSLYSLMDFRGTDPSGYEGSDTSGLVPFIDTDYFAFGYGDTAAGERIIDAQFASSTSYVANTSNDDGGTLFGVNFADGRIKGYGLSLFGQDKTFYVLCVRGNTNYGENQFFVNADGSVTDGATGLMWEQGDSVDTLDWAQALDWVAQRNTANHLGYDDWRLPNAKELQSLVDYGRSPDTTGSAAIDGAFEATAIINEAGDTDYAAYWSSTTHGNWSEHPGSYAAYVNFGRSMGYMNGHWVDVHGAGAQRSDPKTGDPAEYPFGHGPQGDAIRIFNLVRLVRDTD